jgi:CRISPR-associated protein Csb1
MCASRASRSSSRTRCSRRTGSTRPYLLESKNKTFANILKAELSGLGEGPIDRRQLAATLLKYDAGSLVHGVFLAKPWLAGGRLRVARALSRVH